jgi:hypothetical protein
MEAQCASLICGHYWRLFPSDGQTFPNLIKEGLLTIRSESARSRFGTQSLGVKLHLRPPAIDLALWQTYHFRWWLLAPNS